MEKIGIVRKISNDGRISLPREILERLELKTNDELEIFQLEDGIFLKKFVQKKNNK